MSKFTVYQINFTNSEVNKINAGEMREVYVLYLKTIMFPQLEAIENARALYKKVAEVEADNLEHVFKIGNVGLENRIKRLTTTMHSLSVGDLIKTPQGKVFYVDTFGFKEVPSFKDI